MMKSRQFIATLKKIATEYKTKYMWGAVGNVITQPFINDRVAQWPRYYSATYIKELQGTIGKNYFGFDCIGIIKSVLWGWSGSTAKAHGGAVYLSNSVPDVGADWTDKMLLDRSTDMSTVKAGEAVCFPGHIGVYIGDGKVVEAEPEEMPEVLPEENSEDNEQGGAAPGGTPAAGQEQETI